MISRTFTSKTGNDPTLSAIRLLQDLNRSGKRNVPPDAPMPFRKDWKQLVVEGGSPSRRLYETAVFATLRDKLRSGDIWVEQSSDYRHFDSYLLPPATVPAIATELGLPTTADEWLAARGRELDHRLKRFARRLRRGELEGVELRDGRLRVAPVKAAGSRCSCRSTRRDAAPCPHHRAAARGQSNDRPRLRIHQPAHRRKLRQRECVACHYLGRCHQPRADTHGGGEPGRHPRSADLDSRCL